MAFSKLVTTRATFPPTILNRLRLSPSPFAFRSFFCSTTDSEDEDSPGSTIPIFRSYIYTKAKLALALTGAQNIPWVVEEDKEAMYAKLEIPGIGKSGLKLTVEDNKVFFKGEELDRDPSFFTTKNEKPIKVKGHIVFPVDLKMDEMRVYLNNGVLRFVVPKLTS